MKFTGLAIVSLIGCAAALPPFGASSTPSSSVSVSVTPSASPSSSSIAFAGLSKRSETPSSSAAPSSSSVAAPWVYHKRQFATPSSS
ncbi:hypothetical protein AFLA70_569g000480, partial [Aspergillus flavus AF70]